MEILLQFILIVAIFLPVRWFAWKMTEVWGLPQWLQYKPFICKLCLTFWLLIGAYTAIWISFACLIVGIGGILLAILNAVAMYVDQKNKTIKL